MPRIAQTLCVAAVPLLLAGCATSGSEQDGRVTEQWQGRWNGPEGTYLDITGTPADYRLTIADLDGSADILAPHLAEALTYRGFTQEPVAAVA